MKANFDNLTINTIVPDKQEFFLKFVIIELLGFRLSRLQDIQALYFLAHYIIII